MSGVPLLVRAHLASGIAHAGPWGIALDGLLAAELWADRKAAGELAPALHDVDEPEDLPLPLERCVTSTGLWHWASDLRLPRAPRKRCTRSSILDGSGRPLCAGSARRGLPGVTVR